MICLGVTFGYILATFVFNAGIANAADVSHPPYSSKNWTPELIALDKASSAARNYAENDYGVGILIHLGADIPSKNVKNGDELGQLFVNRFAKLGISARYFIAPNGDAPSTGIIRWDCDCDFDLAVKPVGGKTISYRKPRTSIGRLFKDFTSSEALNNGWETVALSGVIDISQLTLAINLYRGSGHNSEVELRVAIGGETWAKSFVIPGPADGGQGFDRTLARRSAANPAWILVDPLRILEGR